MPNEARSKGNSPPQALVSAILLFTAVLRSFTTSRADTKSLTRPPSISSFELCGILNQVLAQPFKGVYTCLNSLSDISVNDTPSDSQRRPMVAYTTDARTLRLAKPSPTPYKERTRVNVSSNCCVGMTNELWV
jgi:hypothetical protein